MIVDSIVSVLLGFFEWVLELLPSFTAPVLGDEPFWFTASHWVGGTGGFLYGAGPIVYEYSRPMSALQGWIDLPNLMLAVSAMVAVSVAVTLAKVALWVYDRIPFKAS